EIAHVDERVVAVGQPDHRQEAAMRDAKVSEHVALARAEDDRGTDDGPIEAHGGADGVLTRQLAVPVPREWLERHGFGARCLASRARACGCEAGDIDEARGTRL